MMRLSEMKPCPLAKVTVIFFLTSIMLSCGGRGFSERIRQETSRPEEAWSATNDPRLLRDQFKTVLGDLPTAGQTRVRPWSDSYWPNYQGGLAHRWNDPDYPDPFTYTLNEEATVRLMTKDEVSRLSPAEKYDIYMGNFTYPLVKLERTRTHPDDPGWFGLCHGWAPAALNFREPRPTVVKGPSGIEIPFGASDIKALLTLAQQFGIQTKVMGERCNSNLTDDPDRGRDPACRDVNAGSFHIALTNILGLARRGFIAEIARGYEVWNQPVYAYTSKIESESSEVPSVAAPGTVKTTRISTEMRYIAEIGAHWDTPLPIIDASEDPAVFLEYVLELDAEGAIIGGEWITEDHPDFLWMQSAPRWFGYYEGIRDIYSASQTHAAAH